MKRKPAVHRVVTVATLSPRGKPTAKGASGGNGVLEEHRNLMTRGELIFCLRDVHCYWSTPRISCSEVEELERQNLIQRNSTAISTAICAIRLTPDGARVKAAAQNAVKA
jgi:hypothetical protein